MKNEKRIILASDIHNCHIDWYGVSNEERMNCFVRDLQAEYEKNPYDMLLLLGDYSLDFWEWDTLGCYVSRGESRTREFVERHLSRLPAPWKMIPGNHEQYGEETWREITGCSRKGTVTVGNWLFILLDSFGAKLDPDFHSDGTFTPIDVAFVRAQMEKYPDHRAVLCAHHFDFERETQEGRALAKDPRIACLFSGHVHSSNIASFGEKPLVRTGNYSYSGYKNPKNCIWGFREVILTKDSLTSRYITPENKMILDGEETAISYGTQDEIRLNFA